MTSARIAAAGPPGAGPAAARWHQASLDGLRAAAAGAVLLTHVGGLTGYTVTGTPVSWVLSRGDVGVPIFFTLSGLLLYRPWAAAALTGQQSVTLGTYLRRRALRILPAYWAVVIVALLWLNAPDARHAWPWVQYLLLIQNYDAHPWWSGTGAIGLAQAWSLVVEVSFYLVLPLIAAVLTWVASRGGPPGPPDAARRARRLLTGIAVLGASSFGFAVLTQHPRLALWFEGTLPPLMIWFCAGMATAVLLAWAAAEDQAGPAGGPASRLRHTVAASTGMGALIAGCAFAMACTPLTGPEFAGVPSVWETEFKTALYTLIALAIVAPAACQPAGPGAARPGLAARVLSSRPGRFLGKISYGAFLWQFLAAFAFFRVLGLKMAPEGGHYTGAEVALIGVAIAAVTVAAATASYYLIEKPAQRLNRYWRRSSATRRATMRRPRIWGIPLVSPRAAGLAGVPAASRAPMMAQTEAVSSRAGSSHGPDSHAPALGHQPDGAAGP
jgi:peptidoglycan/LPS O-acetylase OafA/YrhL